MGRPETVAEMLEHVVGLLDASELIVETLARSRGEESPLSGKKTVQQDLKALAAKLSSCPDLDRELYAALT